MTKSPRLPLAVLAVTALVCAWPAIAAKVDRHAGLYAEMDAASQRYREARIRVQAGDDASLAVLSKALEDLEQVMQRCLKTKGCDTTRVITSYETLLKSADLGPKDLVPAATVAGAAHCRGRRAAEWTPGRYLGSRAVILIPAPTAVSMTRP